MLSAADLNPQQEVSELIAGFWAQLSSLEPEYGVENDVSDADARAFAESIVSGVVGSLSEIDGAISGLLDDWDISRLGTVERVVLRIGIWEISKSNAPAPVVINEAVDLVNWFSTPKSRSLVNAVLDRFAKSRNGK